MYTRIQLAQKSLTGISIGDAFGESFFGDADQILAYIAKREIPPGSWEFTDDTVMAIAIFEQLEKNGAVQQDELARQFVANHDKDPNRGYGATARRILREIGDGADWRTVASSVYLSQSGARPTTSEISKIRFGKPFRSWAIGIRFAPS